MNKVLVGGVVAGSAVVVTGAVIGINKLKKKVQNAVNDIVESSGDYVDKTFDIMNKEFHKDLVSAIDEFTDIYLICDNDNKELLDNINRIDIVEIKYHIKDNEEPSISEELQQALLDEINLLITRLHFTDKERVKESVERINEKIAEIDNVIK